MLYRLAWDSGNPPAEAVRAFLNAWTCSPALRVLLRDQGAAFEGTTLDARVSVLEKAADSWDFRAGNERLDLVNQELPVAVETVERTTRLLGMRNAQQPAAKRYDHVVILGGTSAATFLRTKLARDLNEGGIEVAAIAGLGAKRPLAAKEKRLLQKISAPQALMRSKTEFDALAESCRHFFVLTAERKDLVDRPLAAFMSYMSGKTIVRVLAAHPLEESTRATTADNYASYREFIRPGDRILVCTSAIYVPYQFFVALNSLPWDRSLEVEAVGFPPDWLPGVLDAPQNYLQELRSSIRAVSALVHRLELGATPNVH